MTLAEILIAAAIMSLIALISFEILIRGMQYLRLNQTAIDAQRSGLALSNQVCLSLQTAGSGFISCGPSGVVFPSPYRDDGSSEFDPTTQKLVWRKWICYYYEPTTRTVTRREASIVPPSANPGVPPTPSSFSGQPNLNQVGSNISVFSVTLKTPVTIPPTYVVNITAGDMNDASSYGVELSCEVCPRN